MQSLRVVLAVGLKRQLAGRRMDHAAAHEDTGLQHLIGQANFAQGVDAAARQGEVDGATVFLFMAARVGAFLVQIDASTGAGEETSQQRAGEARADDGDVRFAALDFGHTWPCPDRAETSGDYSTSNHAVANVAELVRVQLCRSLTTSATSVFGYERT